MGMLNTLTHRKTIHMKVNSTNFNKAIASYTIKKNVKSITMILLHKIINLKTIKVLKIYKVINNQKIKMK